MELISLKTAALITRESTKKLRRLIAENKITTQRKAWGRVYIIKSSLIAYYQNQLLEEFQHKVPPRWQNIPSYKQILERIKRIQSFSKKITVFKKKKKSHKKRKNMSAVSWLIILVLLSFGLFAYWIWSNQLYLDWINF